jgi:hypothetical protein
MMASIESEFKTVDRLIVPLYFDGTDLGNPFEQKKLRIRLNASNIESVETSFTVVKPCSG